MKIELECVHCNKTFLREKKLANQNARLGYKPYCNSECKRQAQITALSLNCHACGKEVVKKQSEVKKSKSGFVYCSHSCARAVNDFSQIFKGENHPNYTNGKASYRKFAFEHYGILCSVCGYDIEEVLEVHHRDSNRENNVIENLDVLCPTHHTEYDRGIRIY
jgi:hypothetical protein